MRRAEVGAAYSSRLSWGAHISKKTKAYEDGLRAFEQKDYDRAFRLLIRFAEGGDAEAEVIIGNVYHLGLGGGFVDSEEAVRWYRRASAQGNGVASNNLGTIASVKGDEEGAERWYEKAKVQGFAHLPSRRG
jgi:TPR repeat protein